MCKFCDNLKRRVYKIPYRNSMGDDNRCEYGSPDVVNIDGEIEIIGSNCDNCQGCAEDNQFFSMCVEGNSIRFAFYHKIKNLIISPNSEVIKINFCPWCGRKITDNSIDFDKCCLGEKLEEQI